MYPLGDSSDSLWFYTFDMGWLWTCRAFYPWIYQANTGCWFYYMKDTSAPRWFYNLCLPGWEAH